jgi:hypothetical protein
MPLLIVYDVFFFLCTGEIYAIPKVRIRGSAIYVHPFFNKQTYPKKTLVNYHRMQCRENFHLGQNLVTLRVS